MQTQPALDLSRVFRLEPHGPDTYLAESPHYPWGRIYGGLVIAQALWAATQTVREEHSVHSLHAYFILGGEFAEPVRYEVDRVRNGRSFTTRRVIARQSAGAILTLECSFQRYEEGVESQPLAMPASVPPPDALPRVYDAGLDRCEVPARSRRPAGEGSSAETGQPGSLVWARFPLPLGADARLHFCALAYLSDMNAMDAVSNSRAGGPPSGGPGATDWMGASLDHAVWFHRPVRADDWLLMDMTGHGLIRTRGLATGHVFDRAGVHVATIAQEGLLRPKKAP
jgi:acyl-CoA thioesterase II